MPSVVAALAASNFEQSIDFSKSPTLRGAGHQTREPPRDLRRAILLAAFAAIVVLAGVAALEAARGLHVLLDLAQAGR